MKQIRCKTFADSAASRTTTGAEDGLVNRNRKKRALAHLAGYFFATALPLAAQGIPQSSPPAPTATSLWDTAALAREANVWLAQLIQINTTNPPGNEQAAAKYVAGILEKEGITPEILEVAPGRNAVVARLRNAAISDPARALLLVAHLDVVGAERARWSVDPFGAVIKDGYIYGRGALDDKSMLAANLATIITLKRANARLNRDVIFLATADEEGGGDASIKTLIARNWDKFAAGYALNEGGEVIMNAGKVRYVAVQASEKVSVNVAVVAKGTAGHASLPTKDNPVAHLSAAVSKISSYSAPVHFTAIVRRYFEGLAAISDDEIAKWMRSLETSDRGEHAQRVISEANPEWGSMIRDSIAPTMLNAGVRPNVIPGEARAILNIRLLPGDPIDVLLGELRKLVNDPQVRLDVQPDGGLAAPPSSLESDFYAAISKVAAEEFPGAPVLPYQSPWATDSAQLRLHNVQAYGLWPFPITGEDLKRLHGDDERISIASFNKGVDVLVHIVSEFAVAK